MHYTEDGIHLLDPLFAGPQERLAFMGIPLQFDEITPATLNRSTFSFWHNQQQDEETLPEILERHYHRLAGKDLNQSLYSDGLKESMRKVYDQCSAGLLTPNIMVTSPQMLRVLQDIKEPTINRGRMVAEAWEKYVRHQPMDSLLNLEYFDKIKAPIEYTTAPEQPTIGLF